MSVQWPWRRAPASGSAARWAVVDVEASGLDARSDRLLAIAGIALRVDWTARRCAIDIGDSFEVVIRQEEASSRDNILLHGIGVQRQREGWPAAQALEAFGRWVGKAPRVAFHAAFDETLIRRTATACGVGTRGDAWLDIEHLCAATHGHVRARSLDEWMAHFGITCARRHEAAADTLAECELLLRIWPRIARECASLADVRRLAAQHRWVPRA